MNKIPVIATVFLLAVAQAHGQWNVAHFGSGQLTYPFDVRVAKARNDSTNRVYVSERNGRITEWNYGTGSWSKTVVVSAVSNLALMAIGDVRNDGTNRLYYAEYNKWGDLHEVTWTGTNWSRITIDQDRSSLNIFIGDGRNDGRQRLYVGGASTSSPSNPFVGLWEYTWSAGSWQKLQLHATGADGRGTVGNLRNDGVMRVLGNGIGNSPSFFYDFTWSGSSYASFPIDVASYALSPDPTDVGCPRNDRTVRVVANTQQGKREYTWNGSAWQSLTFDPLNRRGNMRVARLKSDGLYRIYTSHSSTPAIPLKEFSWNPSTSQYASNTVVDAVTGATAMFDAGNGRNDGVARLYAPNYAGGELLEITSDSPYVYAAPDGGLRLNGLSVGTGTVRVSVTNLTARCEYRVRRASDHLADWQQVGAFTATGTSTNWLDAPTNGAAFYQVLGRPQPDP